MRSTLIAAAAAALVAGCATTPLPDGSRIERLPESAAPAAPALGAEEAHKLEQLNAQILAEQNAARQREQDLEAWTRAQQHTYIDLHYGYRWPYYGAPYWGWQGAGRYPGRHPRWSWGFGWHGTWPR